MCSPIEDRAEHSCSVWGRLGVENLYGLGSWVGTAPWGPAGGMETLGICMAIKEIRQGINTAFLPLVGAAERGWTDSGS